MSEIFDCIRRNDPSKLQNLMTIHYSWIDVMDDNGNTPLLVASRLGFAKCVRILISSRADVYHVNRSGFNALTMASLSGSVETVDSILRVSSIEHFMKKSLVPPLAAAIFGGHKEVVYYLLQIQKPFQTTTTREGNSPLMLSIMFDRPDIAHLFSDEPKNLINALGMTAKEVLEYRQKFIRR